VIPTVVLLWACEPVPPADRTFAPRIDAPSVVAAAPAVDDPRTVPGEPVVEAAPSPEPVPAAELYRGLGLGDAEPAAVAPAPAPAPAPVEAPLPAAAGMVWLVSTLPHAVPPRAILGAPDGSERVVRPGAVVEDLGLIVLAIGEDLVHVAVVQSDGDHATLEQRQLQALYPSR